MAEIREVLSEVCARLATAPDAAADLLDRRKAAGDALHRAIDAVKEIEARTAGAVAAETDGNGGRKYPNEASRAAEITRRLAADREYQAAKAEVERLRAEVNTLDVEIERVGRRHRSDANLVYLVASLFQSGRADLAEAALAAYGQAKPEPQEVPLPPGLAGDGEKGSGDKGGRRKNDGLLDAEVVVLEVRVNEKGVARAWCQDAETGDKVAVYAKNGAGQTLASAVRKKVAVRYRVVDKGWFAAEVRAVS